MVPIPDGERVILFKSMDKWLARVCYELKVPNPAYFCENDVLPDGTPICRFLVTLSNNSLGQKLMAIGRFAENQQLAREDAALSMLGELLRSTRIKIHDFNHHQVLNLQQQLAKLEVDLTTTTKENARLKEELGRMKASGQAFLG